MVDQNRTSIREVFQQYIFEAEANGEVIELLEPMGLLDGIKDLGIEDLTEKEIQYLIRVLGKPELESAIIVDEFLQILENIGMYDDQPMGGMDDDEMDGDMSGAPAAAAIAELDESGKQDSGMPSS